MDYPKTLKEFYALTKCNSDTYLHIFCRYLSLPLTRFFYNTSLTPNYISLLGVFSWLFAFILFFANIGFIYDLLGFFLFFLAYLVDFSDGSIARLKGLSSLVGAFLDPSLDQVRNQFLFFLLAYRAWSLQGDVSFLYLYIGFFIIATITHALDVQKNILLLRATHQYESVERFFGIKSGSFYSILVNIYESTHSIFLLVLASFLFMIPFSEYFFVKLFFVAYASSYLFKLCFISFVALKQFARMDAKAK